MSFWTLGRFALVLSIPGFVAACVVDSSPPPEISSAGGGASPAPVATSVPDSDGGPSEHPILAPIDTNQTMNAAAGEGVGVFAQYSSGGGWKVWWTCDSLIDSQNPPCQFDVKISVGTGAIALPAAQGFQASDTFTATATQLEGVTTTTTASDGMTFQTAPGAVITLSATIGGQYDGRFIFFVEGGKVDDGYTGGAPTDPIQLTGSTP